MPQIRDAPVPRRVLVAFGLAAVALYAPLVGWGLPHANAADRTKTWATDEILPLEGLAEMRSTFLSPAPDRNFGYPLWHYFVVSAAQAPYLGGLYLSGGLEAPSASFPFGLRDPVRALEVLTVIGRLVSVAMAAGIVIASCLFAGTLFGHRAGVVAAALTLTSFPLVYYGRTGNLDVPALFWSALGFVVLARMLFDGASARRAAWLGLFAALAVATKDQAVALFVPVCVAPFVPGFAPPRDTGGRARAFAVFVGCGLAAYVAATGMLIDPRRHLAHLEALLFAPQSLTSADAYFSPAPSTLAGTWTLAAASATGLAQWYTWPVLLAAAAGFILAVRRNRRHALWLLPLVVTFLAVVRPVGVAVLRYYLPMTLFVDAFAALALVRLAAIGAAPYRLAVAALVALRLAMGLDLSYAQWHDTRYAAGEWLRARLRPGERIEYFGVTDKLPALAAATSSRRVLGRERWLGERGPGAAMRRDLADDGPELLIVIPDWTSGSGREHSADCPPEVYAALLDGSAGYELVAHFPPPTLVARPFGRARLDSPSVAPPVRIFARATRTTGGEPSPPAGADGRAR